MNLKYNLGCGSKYKDGWINVDLYADTADVKEDIRVIELPEMKCAKILCVHTIEHLTKDEGVNLINKCAAALAPEGKVIFEAPCWDKCTHLLHMSDFKLRCMGMKGILGGRSYNKDKWHHEIEQFVKNKLFPGQEGHPLKDEWNAPGENHLYMWRADELASALNDAGLFAEFWSPKYHGPNLRRDFRVIGV